MSNYAKLFLGRKRAVLAFAVSATILLILAVKINVRLHAAPGQGLSVADQLGRVSWPILLATFGFSAFWHTVVGADKWWRILRAMGAEVPWSEVFRVRLGSDPIRFASPMKVGEIVNAVYFSRLKAFGFSRAAGSVAFDKAINFFGTLVWLYVGMIAMLQVPPAGYILLHSTMGAGVVVVFALRPVRELFRRMAAGVSVKLGRLAAGILAAFEEFTFTQKIGFLVYGAVFQLRPLIVCYLLFVSLRPHQMPSMEEFLAFGSVAVLMSNIPLTIGGIGPREASIIALFAPYADPLTLLSVGVLMSFSIQVIPAILGIPFLFGLLRSLAAIVAESQQEAGLLPAAADSVVTVSSTVVSRPAVKE